MEAQYILVGFSIGVLFCLILGLVFCLIIIFSPPKQYGVKNWEVYELTKSDPLYKKDNRSLYKKLKELF